MLDLDRETVLGVALTLLAGTPAISFLGGVGAALTATLRRGGLLGAVVVLPLCAPALIFGVAAASAIANPAASFVTPFLLLCALSLLAVAGAPFAAAAALRRLRD